MPSLPRRGVAFSNAWVTEGVTGERVLSNGFNRKEVAVVHVNTEGHEGDEQLGWDGLAWSTRDE